MGRGFEGIPAIRGDLLSSVPLSLSPFTHSCPPLCGMVIAIKIKKINITGFI
jgi:hypothetical protein